MNVFDPNNFSSVPGVRCCDCPGCFLTMPTQLIDGTTTNYSDLTAATNALADQAAPGCFAEGRPQGSETRTTFSSSFSSGTLAVDSAYTASGDGAQDKVLSFVSLTVADGLSVVYNITSDAFIAGCIVALYQDDGTTLVDSVSGTAPFAGTFSPTIPADGNYYIRASNGGLGATSTTISLSCTGGASLSPCGVRAAYDDGSGGTSYVICT